MVNMRKKVMGMLCAFLVLMMLFTMLSRAADSMGIPRVQTDTIQNMVITHKVTASGKVVQNREQAVSTEPNQIVKAIYVGEGQQVEAGDLLFELDMEELKEQILTAKQELEKQELQAGDSRSAKDAAAASRALEQKHAASGYEQAKSQGDRTVQKAKEELDAAKKALENYLAGNGNTDGISGEDEVAETLENTLREKEAALEQAKNERESLEKEIEQKIREAWDAFLQNSAQPSADGENSADSGEASSLECQRIETEIRSSYQSALDAAIQKEAAAKSERDGAEQALNTYRQNQISQSEASARESEEQLRQAVREKEDVYEQAVLDRNNSLQSAENALESANAPQSGDSQADIAAIEREQKELELKKLENLEAMEGKVLAPVKGVVTKVTLTTGDRTPDGTAVLLADLSSGSKFKAQIPSDQEKYVARKDPVVLKPGSGGKEIEGLTIDSIRTSDDDENLLDVTINLPADVLEIGTVADMEVTKKSEAYPCCIPLSALHYDDKQAYVLVAEESKTVLGSELIARRLDVTVLDKNNQYAALEDGILIGEQKLLSSSDRVVEPGSRIRPEE